MKRNKFRLEHVASERARITLQIEAVLAPYRHGLVRDDPAAWAGYRLRASRLLDGLDGAARPFPDLQASLAAARVELGLE